MRSRVSTAYHIYIDDMWRSQTTAGWCLRWMWQKKNPEDQQKTKSLNDNARQNRNENSIPYEKGCIQIRMHQLTNLIHWLSLYIKATAWCSQKETRNKKDCSYEQVNLPSIMQTIIKKLIRWTDICSFKHENEMLNCSLYLVLICSMFIHSYMSDVLKKHMPRWLVALAHIDGTLYK